MSEPAFIRISPVFDSSVWNLQVIGEETFMGIAGKELTMPVYKNLPCEPIGYTLMQVDEKGYALYPILRVGYSDPQVFPTKGSALGAYEKAVLENQTTRYPYWEVLELYEGETNGTSISSNANESAESGLDLSDSDD